MGVFRRLALVSSISMAPSVGGLHAAAARLEGRIIDHGTSVDEWRVEGGSLVLDRETFASRGASLRIGAPGVYERAAPVEECERISFLLLPRAKRPVRIVGHLRDRDRAHYILETRELKPSGNWQLLEFSVDSAALASWSMDLNHRLDFPLSAIGLMVSMDGDDTVNIDRVSVSTAVGEPEKLAILRERTLAWTNRLASQPRPPFPSATQTADPVTSVKRGDTWVVKAPYYRARFDARKGLPTQLEFGPPGAAPVRLQMLHPWSAITWEGQEIIAGAAEKAEWEPKLKYLAFSCSPVGGVSGELRYLFRGREIEIQLRLHNASAPVIRWVRFPGTMGIPRENVTSVVWPRLGGVELLPAFFEQGRSSRAAYPADGFSDWVGFRMEGRTVALGTIQAGPFFQSSDPVLRGDTDTGNIVSYHDVSVFIPPKSSWTLSPAAIWLSESPEEALRRYRAANGWEQSPSLRQKLGDPLFERMRRAPLLKWDLDALSRDQRSSHKTFSEAATWVRSLPGTHLVHPVAYWNPPGRGPQAGVIFDQNYPNFLPGAERLGGDTKFLAFLSQTRSLGHVVAPYINPTAWSPHARGFEAYGEEIAILTERGVPHWGWGMYSADPAEPRVEVKTQELVAAFTGSHRVDLLFEDQVGARENYLNLRDRAPHPTAYADGWIRHAARVSKRIPLMTERGFDALIPHEAAFCGVELGLACARYMPGWEWDSFYGAGNWRVFPVESFLCHDKCALYHHDLGQFVLSDADLAWCLVKGYNLQSYYPGEEKWLRVCQAFQEAVGPAMFGEPLVSFEYLTESVIESRFPSVRVLANLHPDIPRFVEGNHSIPPHGVLVVGEGVRLLAGVVKHLHGRELGDRRYLVESRVGDRIIFRDVLPTGEKYQLPLSPEWKPSAPVRGEAVTARGSFPIAVRRTASLFEFTYPVAVEGEPVVRVEFSAAP